MFKSFVDGLNGISNTIWGILILLSAIGLGVFGKTELCYYFAGVGATLAGISGVQHVKDSIGEK